MTDRDGSAPRGRLGAVVGMLVRRFEEAIYGIAFLLLAAAAVLVVIGTFGAVVQVVTRQVSTLEGGVLVLERTLLTLIIAELAYTLRTDFLHHEIAAEPFLYIGLIAAVRRMLIVTAEFEQPQSDQELNRLLLELGVLALLVLAIAAAIFLIRYGVWKFVPRPASS
ncbi:MAG TPA: phosphate-starvation-inducible PsiE family protein [Candidatus Angelobacter sp.]|nr:phosphate-starvation-inducible PsiE family protein [Candidatus Angelobacter sp.]